MSEKSFSHKLANGYESLSSLSRILIIGIVSVLLILWAQGALHCFDHTDKFTDGRIHVLGMICTLSAVMLGFIWSIFSSLVSSLAKPQYSSIVLADKKNTLPESFFSCIRSLGAVVLLAFAAIVLELLRLNWLYLSLVSFSIVATVAGAAVCNLAYCMHVKRHFINLGIQDRRRTLEADQDRKRKQREQKLQLEKQSLEAECQGLAKLIEADPPQS